MTCRALALGLCASATTLVGCCIDPDEPVPTVLDLETDVDLHAVVQVPFWDSYPASATLAVGAAGTVIAWGVDYDYETNHGTEFSRHVQVGDSDLRDAWMGESAWWVVGDAGTAAVSADRGTTWALAELGTEADLRGIILVGSRLVVVGDEIVLVQGGDGIWTEAPAPEGGWGDLQAIHDVSSRAYAVGLAGKAWSTSDPSGEWVAEDVGTDVDLFDVGSFETYHDDDIYRVIVGAAGTLLIDKGDGWNHLDTGVDADLIDFSDGGVLADSGGFYEIGRKGRLKWLETLDAAESVVYDGLRLVAVGAEGAAYEEEFYLCHYE